MRSGLPAAGPAGAAAGAPRPGTFLAVWSPCGDAAGPLLWQAGLCLEARQQPVILADLDLYTPGLAVAAGLLTPTGPASVLDACLTQQVPTLGSPPLAPTGHGAAQATRLGNAPRLLSPDGHPLIRILPGLLDLRGLDVLAVSHLDVLGEWLAAQPGWRLAAVSTAADCAATIALLAIADRLIVHVPRHPGRDLALTQFWAARASHFVRSLPGVRAEPELWLPGWEPAAAARLGAELECPAIAIAIGRRRHDNLAAALGLKTGSSAVPERGDYVAVR